jgi:hypothetical protein
MPAPISLNEVPQKLLDRAKWAKVRSFASNDLIALTYLNAPYPDQDNPTDFFWGRGGSFEDALRCYESGRWLVSQCRRLLIHGKLVATGTKPGGARIMIMDWTDLWPMFATNRATGPSQSFNNVEILESTEPETRDAKMLRHCVNWLHAQSPTTLGFKKVRLLHQARLEIGANLTQAIFNAAYRAVLGHSRGRPKSLGVTIA